jgi:ribosomal protein S27AE
MNELQEAPASVTYSITSPTGFPALFTIREMTGLALLTKMESIEKKFIDLGYKPQIRQAFGQKKELVYADHTCPICGKRVVLAETKDGRKLEKCETQTWDPTTKSPKGCAYTKWL